MTETTPPGGRTLPDRSGEADRDARLRDWLRDRARHHRGDRLAAITLPYLAGLFRAGTRVVPPGSGRVLRAYEDLKARTALRTPFYEAGDIMLAFATVNQARAVREPVRRYGEPRRLRTVRPSWRALRAHSRRGRALGDELIETLDLSLLPPGLTAREIVYGCFVGAAMLSLAEEAVRGRRPRVAVVSSAHGLAARALAVLARERGFPSVYIPHAPALTDTELADLPFDYAALRGRGEVEHYADSGVDPARLDVAGDPSIDRRLAPASVDPHGPTVFAPSPDPPAQVKALMALVAAATSGQVVVSPHPRSDVALLRSLAPKGWSFWDGRTLELLVTGPPVLLQRSSGVALEALQLGIPVVELSFPGDPTPYPFIQGPFLRFASTADELRRAVQEARGADDDERGRLVDWSRRWVAAVGPDAAARAAGVIDRARREGPRASAIWDAWGAGRR